MCETKFEVGDRVVMTRTYPKGSYFRTSAVIGATGTVGPKLIWSDKYGGPYLDIIWKRDSKSGNQSNGGYLVDHFELIEECCELDKAKDVLEKNGYTITPPKPKLAGRVVIYCWNHDYKNWRSVEEEAWDKSFRWTPDRHDLQRIAIVDWEEGQGLTRTTEGDGL
jgi:hypothetical protein